MEGCDYCKNYRETPRGEEEFNARVPRKPREGADGRNQGDA